MDERHYIATFGGAPHNVTYDDDKATWLAVLLVTPADLAGQHPERQLVRGAAVDLAPAAMKMKAPGGGTVPGALPAGGYSIFSYTLEPGQAPSDGTSTPASATPLTRRAFISTCPQHCSTGSRRASPISK